MRFTIRASAGSARLGQLIGSDQLVAIATPGYLIYTRCGSDPHVVSHLLQEQSVSGAALIPLNRWLDKLQLLRLAGDFRQLCRMPPNRLLFLSLSDHLDHYPTAGVTAQHCCLPTRSGKAQLSPELQAELLGLVKPQLVQPLADCEVLDGDGRKRCKKSVDRTLAFLDRFLAAKEQLENSEQQRDSNGTTLGSAVFASWVGGFNVDERLRCLRELDSRGVHGYAVEGFRYYNQPVESFRLEQCSSVLKEALHQHQPAKPIYFPGLVHPADIVRAISLGVDLFDGSLPTVLTRGCLAWLTGNQADCGWFLRLADAKLLTATDRALDSACDCRCCREYSLSYLAHLALSGEILASILLMEHNAYRMAAFFDECRNSIEAEAIDQLVLKYSDAFVPSGQLTATDPADIVDGLALA